MSGEPLIFELELQPGEKLTLPPAVVDRIGSGRWVVTIQPASTTQTPVRDHTAFLRSYAPEDEGLYDDCAAR